MKTLFAALLLCLAAVQAEATVLIYKGTSLDFTQTDPGISPTEGCILVVDLQLNEMSLIIWHTQTEGKVKLREQVLEIQQQTLDTTLVSGPGKTTYEFFAHVANTEAGGRAFGDQIAFFRGPVGKVNVSGSPKNYNEESHPLALVGEYRYLGSGFGTSYTQHTISLAYSQALTVPENNGDKTIVQAEADMIAYVKGLGYLP